MWWTSFDTFTLFSKKLFTLFSKKLFQSNFNVSMDDVLNLDSQVYCAIDSFKQIRNYKAHPKLKVADVRSRLSAFQLDDKDKAMISRMTDIWMNLQLM